MHVLLNLTKCRDMKHEKLLQIHRDLLLCTLEQDVVAAMISHADWALAFKPLECMHALQVARQYTSLYVISTEMTFPAFQAPDKFPAPH